MALDTLAASLALALLAAGASATTAPPAWSNYGPAERRFDAGFVMFAEYRDARWHAWVPSYWWSWTGADAPSRKDGWLTSAGKDQACAWQVSRTQQFDEEGSAIRKLALASQQN